MMQGDTAEMFERDNLTNGVTNSVGKGFVINKSPFIVLANKTAKLSWNHGTRW
jgi:hypothetical protein